MKRTLLLLAVLLLTACSPGAPEVNLQAECEEHKGTWLAEHLECEHPDSREWCESAGGTFQECESACRHDSEAEICTLQCVIVCKF